MATSTNAATLAILVKANTTKATAELSRMQSKLDSTTMSASKMVAANGRLGKSFAANSKEVDKSSQGFGRFGRTVIEADHGINLFSRSLKLLKWPSLIAGAGGAAQGLSAAAGGAAALTGALAPGVGLLSQYGTALGVLGQVKAVTALSGINDVTTAVGGLNSKLDTSASTFKELAPEAQKFAVQLEKMKEPLRGLQSSVQRSLFGGLTKAVTEAEKNLPAFQHVLVGTSKALSGLAQQFGHFVGSKGFGADFKKLGDVNNRVLSRMGKVGINLAHVFIDVMMAARPLTNWISRMAVAWSVSLKGAAEMGRESGRLTKFFEQTRQVTSRLLSIIGSLGKALWNIISLGKPLGDSILKALDKSAQSFADWTASASGQNKIARYFEDIKPPLFEAGKLVGDIVVDFVKLGQTKGLTELLRRLRTEFLPVLMSTVKSTTQAFGPHLIDLLINVSKLFANLAGSSGPLTLYVDLLSQAAKWLNQMFKAFPGLKTVVVALIGLKGVLGAIKITGLVTGFSRLTGVIRGTGAAAAATTVEMEGLAVAGAGAKGGLLARLGLTGGAAAVTAVAAPLAAIAAAMKGIDETGLLDAGGPVSKTPLGSLLGIKQRSFTQTVDEMQTLSKSIGGIKQHTDDLAKTAPADLNHLNKSLSVLGATGHTTFSNQGELIRRLEDQYGTFANAGRQMSHAQKKAWIDFAQQAEINGQISLNTLQKLTDQFQNSSRKWRNNMKAISDATGESTKKVKDRVGDMNASVSRDYQNMVEVSFAGMKMLVSKTNELTNQLGIKKEIQWSASSGRATGSALSNKGTPTSHARQRGGPIPGQGSGDKVPAMLEPGEFVMNREAVRGIGLARLQAMNKAIPRFASGGAVNADFSGMQPAIVSLAKTFLSKFGGYQSSGLRSGDPGFHGRGLASDIVPNDWAGATRYANQIGSSLLEGIHQGPPGSNVSWDSGHQVPPSFWGAATWAEHVSHIHLATQNAVKGAAKAVQKLKRILIKGAKGPLRDTAQASVDKVWKGANAFIEKQMPTSSFDVAIGKGGGTLTPQQFLAIANQAIKVTHSPGFTAGGLETLAMQESGLRVNPPPPHDINWPNNPSMGLMQVTLDTFKTYHQTGTSRNIVDPLANIAASINYQKARYGHQVTFSPYAKGGLVMPPFGGSFGGGGIVPGPQGAARTIVAHGGEAVGKSDIHIYFKGDLAALRDLIDVEVDGAMNGQVRFHNQKARMRR